MFTRLVWCLALSAGMLAQEAPGHHEPSTEKTAPSISHGHCCRAAERRLKGLALPPEASEPEFLRTLYRFVGSHLGLMTQLPCFCGCDRELGHHSIADCFVEHSGDGKPAAWNTHGTTCGMCMGIARDAMTLSAQKKTALEIRAHIEAKYAPVRTSDPGSAPRKEMR
jgi:hypothetical protein